MTSICRFLLNGNVCLLSANKDRSSGPRLQLGSKILIKPNILNRILDTRRSHPGRAGISSIDVIVSQLIIDRGQQDAMSLENTKTHLVLPNNGRAG